MNIIGVTGFKGSGKDTVGQFFEQHGYTVISFADSLKDCVSVVFGWDRTMLEGRSPKSRKWREENDPWWAEKLGVDFFSPRLAMTRFGTDIMRQYFHDDIWIINTERKINQHERVIITDVRFPNEMALIKRLGGKSIRVRRNPEPDWTNIAKLALQGCELSQKYLADNQIHESEWLLLNHSVDYEMENNGSVSDLYRECEKIIHVDIKVISDGPVTPFEA